MRYFIKIFSLLTVVISINLYFMTLPGVADTGDCTNTYTGKNDTVGLSNGDPRFLCSNSQWYDCGWEGSGNWDLKASDGQHTGSWYCNMATSQWMAMKVDH